MEVKKEVKMEVKGDNRYSRSFKDLDCWKKAHEFVKAVYQVTKLFPEEERYGLTSQFRRADKLRFMNIAQGSLEECRYYIILAYDIEYINQKIYDHLEFLINGASWKLNGYAESISLNKGIIDE